MKQEELTITRLFNAPRERVWQAWSDPKLIKRWWGPKNFTAPHVDIDFRVDGKYLLCMRGAVKPGGDEQNFWSTGVYREIIKPEKIAVTDSFADENGNIVPATHYNMNANFPLEMMLTVLFIEEEEKTKLILRHSGMPTGTDREMAGAGWNQSLDKLAETLISYNPNI